MAQPASEKLRVRVLALVAAFQAKRREDTAKRFPSLDPPVIHVDFGPKYARLYETDHGVCAFVRMEDGAIFYPKSWRGPALKHVRGSVLADDYGLSAFGTYAVKTLR